MVRALIALLLGWTIVLTSYAQENRDDPPNIVVLFADDLGYGDLSSYGHPTIRTPNLDRMAAEGIRFTSFYAAEAACSPSRAALLTGRYAIRSGLTGVVGPDSDVGLPAAEITLAEALKVEGYRTMAVGKWHLGHAHEEYMPTSNGFDSYFGLLYSNDMIRPWVQTDRPLELYRDAQAIEHPVDQSTLTVRYTDEAVRYIESSKGAPFLLYLAYSMPHLPIYAPKKFRGRSRAGLYGDVIETIDWSVGRILETLEKQGLDENTIVVFSSDNGPWLNLGSRMLQGGNKRWHAGSPGPLRGAKGTSYEGGVRVPGIVRWRDRIPAGRTSAEPATTMDLFTTLLTAAGARVPSDRPIDGRNLLPLLTGSSSSSPTAVFYYFRGNRLHGVRDGAWKYRLSRQTDRREELPEDQAALVELFNLDLDPSERFNVASRHPDVVERLDAKLRNFADEVSAETEPPL